MQKNPLQRIALVSACVISGLFFSAKAIAQNVGIGTISPSAKLTVSGAENTVNGQNAGIMINNSLSSNAWIIRAGASGTSTPAGGFSIGDNAAYRLVITNTGNVGIGTLAPQARLHISGGGIKIDGSQALEFGVGISKEINAGKITYGAYSANLLEITGGGTLASNRSIRFFNEGVAWFAGPLYLETGNITRASSGGAGLLPIAYGTISETGAILNGTPNFSVTKNAVFSGSYDIILTGQFMNNVSFTPLITISSDKQGVASPWCFFVEGKLRVAIYSGNSGQDRGYSFVIYRPS
ncbi:hypothetical protein BH10BAC3_BH10BAC3_23740 [soil metagenome]